MKLELNPFTTLAALVQFREDYDKMHGPMTREKLKRESEMDLVIVAERAVTEHIRHIHEAAEALRGRP